MMTAEQPGSNRVECHFSLVLTFQAIKRPLIATALK
jgi:hypothetical protein